MLIIQWIYLYVVEAIQCFGLMIYDDHVTGHW